MMKLWLKLKNVCNLNVIMPTEQNENGKIPYKFSAR